MNRRTAIKYGLLAGGVLPAATQALAQDPGGGTRGAFDDPPEPPRGRTRTRGESSSGELAFPGEADPNDPPIGTNIDVPPANLREEAGHVWKSFDIARYTSQAYTPENSKPQNALVEWIFRTTGSGTWHGEKIAVLSAGRAQLRAYHNPRVLGQVEDTVARFVKATADKLSLRIRFVAAPDTRWRYTVFNRLKRVGTGAQGQQIWTLSPDDSNLVRTQMMMFRGFMLLADKSVTMLNGQTFTIDHGDMVDYIATTQSDGTSAVGPQPRVEPLKEGVTLRISPLLTYEGDALDAAIDLRVTTVKRLIRTRILARRSVGPVDMNIDVPEVVETRLNHTLPNVPLGQVLLISGGIAPGILQRKNGLLNLPVPGTFPTDTELLTFIEIEPVRDAPRTARRRTRAADDQFEPEEPAFRSARGSNTRSPQRGTRDDFGRP